MAFMMARMADFDYWNDWHYFYRVTYRIQFNFIRLMCELPTILERHDLKKKKCNFVPIIKYQSSLK